MFEIIIYIALGMAIGYFLLPRLYCFCRNCLKR